MKLLSALVLLLALSACSTYYDSFDNYARGNRWYDRGKYDLARKDWEPLALAGDCDAEFGMGQLFFFGAGVGQDYAQALSWWTKSANRGEAFAELMLANMYARGKQTIGTVGGAHIFDCTQGCGVEKNMSEAFKWLALAQRNSPYDSHKKSYDRVLAYYRSTMTLEEVAVAESAAQEWKPTPELCKQRRLY